VHTPAVARALSKDWTRLAASFIAHNMQYRFVIWFAFLLAIGLAGSRPAGAEDGRAALQAACWLPSALAARSGENIAVRLRRPVAMRIPDPAIATAHVPTVSTGVIRRVELPPGKKLVALTFDLCETAGETAGYDGAVIDYLRSHGIKATYFAGGQWMVSHKARSQQLMSDPLFEVGTHGWAHRNTRLLSGAQLRREILSPTVAYTAIRSELSQAQCAGMKQSAFSAIPERPTLFRFPFGACNAASLQSVADAGLMAIQWDLATGDPSPNQSARAIADAMIRNARPGSIIISHANGRGYHTAEALPIAIPALRAKGFEFVTISELIAAGKPVVTETCYDVHPGDTDKYDLPFGRKAAASSSWESITTPMRAPTDLH
jgi:peptidoglycan-N-acetylglucosamine deacetylase